VTGVALLLSGSYELGVVGFGTADNGWQGNVYRTTSGPFNAYDASRFSPTLVGTGTFTFTDGSNGTFAYTVDGVTQSKPITRYAFSTPASACAFR